MTETKDDNTSDATFSFVRPGIETRIDEVCRLLGRRDAAAKAAGVSAVMLHRYIRGESKPTFEVMVNLAYAAGVSLDWLATGEGEVKKSKNPGIGAPQSTPAEAVIDTLGNVVDVSEFVFIPRYNVKAAAGHGSDVSAEAPTHSMAFRRYWIEHYLNADPKDLAVLSVRGDSMEGLLSDRDAILINHADRQASSGLFVLRIDGGLVVKRVQRMPGGLLEVSSANELYKSFTVNLSEPHDDFAVIGRVVWIGRQV